MKLKVTYITLILVMMLGSYAKSQTEEKQVYKQIKSALGKIKQPVDDNDRKITFLNIDSLINEPGTAILQIMILRHQKVDMQKQSSYTCREAKRHFEAYDTAQISPLDFSPVYLGNSEIDTIFTSTLARSIETARAVFGNSIPLSNHELFIEYNKDIPPIPIVHLPLGFWKVFSTCEWIAGLESPADESFKQGRQRAEMAGRFLEAKASKKGKTILVGHGFINYYIKKYLKKNGWKMIIDGKNANLGVTLFVKVKS